LSSLTTFVTEESVNRVDPTYLVFDDVVKKVKKATNNDNNTSFIPGSNADALAAFSPYTVSMQTSDALVATLAMACLRLNSTRVKDLQLMQIVFARVYFFNHAKLLPFPILCKNSIIDLSPQAKVHLHGRRLLDLLGPSQEAFIRFVVLVDCMRYHGVILRNFANTDAFSDPDDNERHSSNSWLTTKAQRILPFPTLNPPFPISSRVTIPKTLLYIQQSRKKCWRNAIMW
jgi:hypothetical protein